VNINNAGGANSQTIQQRVNNTSNKKGKDVVVSSTCLSDDLSESFATKVHKAMGHSSAAVGGSTESSSSATEKKLLWQQTMQTINLSMKFIWM
jgi:hypothetical protein